MQKMSIAGAKLVLENGLCYEKVSYIESTEAYHYFSAYIPCGGIQEKQEVRVNAEINIDNQFHIQGRSWGAAYWTFIDTVSCDWSQEESSSIAYSSVQPEGQCKVLKITGENLVAAAKKARATGLVIHIVKNGEENQIELRSYSPGWDSAKVQADPEIVTLLPFSTILEQGRTMIPYYLKQYAQPNKGHQL